MLKTFTRKYSENGGKFKSYGAALEDLTTEINQSCDYYKIIHIHDSQSNIIPDDGGKPKYVPIYGEITILAEIEPNDELIGSVAEIQNLFK